MAQETVRGDSTERGPERPGLMVWPSIAAYPAGRFVGRVCDCRIGFGEFFTLGKLFALATIPLALPLYFWRVLPVVGRRYTITNRRVVVGAGLEWDSNDAIDLDAFDAVDVEVLSGQAWLNAGDVVFRRDGAEQFRLPGVSRPEAFRAACLKARTARIQVREVLEREEAPVG